MDWEKLANDLEIWIRRPADVREIAIYGNDLSAIPENVMTRLLDLCNAFKASGSIKGVRVSVRPDTVNDMNRAALSDFSTIELGIPTLNNTVLKAIEREHSVSDFYQAVDRIQRLGISLGFQTMLGLPASSPRIDIQSARKLAVLQPDFVRIHPALVLNNTLLKRLYVEGNYRPLTLETAVAVTAKVCEVYTRQGIQIARCGFHLPEVIRKSTLIAGPWHPAFGQLVKSRIWRKQLLRRLQRNPDLLVVTVPERSLSNAIGQNRENLIWLRRELKRAIEIKPDDS